MNINFTDVTPELVQLVTSLLSTRIPVRYGCWIVDPSTAYCVYRSCDEVIAISNHAVFPFLEEPIPIAHKVCQIYLSMPSQRRSAISEFYH